MEQDSESAPLQQALRGLPSVDSLLRHPSITALLDEFPRPELLRAIRAAIDERRAEMQSGRSASTDARELAMDVRQKLYLRSRSSVRRVINATGIVLHTGLGRSPLAAEAVEAIADVAAGYCNLELDLETGQRGDRQDHLREILCELTGAEDAVVVNNCAAATYLTLNSLAGGRGVIVSRGQLVEIGGSYRMPDIMSAAGCRMIEVGTTNRTHLSDYERAIRGDLHTVDGYGRSLDVAPAVLLRVHCSNYRVRGFVQSVPLTDLVALRERFAAHGLMVVDDLGSGLLDHPPPGAAERDSARPEGRDISGNGPRDAAADDENATRGANDAGLAADAVHWDEPTVRESVAEGADLTLFSGDKLLGGPQAGIVLGRAEAIDRLKRNPLMRTFRPDKLTLVALEATLRLYRDPQTAFRRIPVLAMLLREAGELERVAGGLEARIRERLNSATVQCARDESFAGGGSLPTLAFPTYVVRVRIPGASCAELAGLLRKRDQPIVCRIQADALVFDCRTLSDDDGDAIAGALAEATREARER